MKKSMENSEPEQVHSTDDMPPAAGQQRAKRKRKLPAGSLESGAVPITGFNVNHAAKISKREQLKRSIILNIERGLLAPGAMLPSINEVSREQGVSRDTIEKAYRELMEEDYVESVASKGYFVKGKSSGQLKVLLLFNKLSSYKKTIYDAIVSALGSLAKIDLQIHHYDPRVMSEILAENAGRYHYYVVMPHFFHGTKPEEYLPALQQLQPHELILLDKDLPELANKHMAVFQNFKEDIYQVLNGAKDLLRKYKRLSIVFAYNSHHPTDLVEGVRQFSDENKKGFSIIPDISKEALKKGTVYIVTSESDLAMVVKKARSAGLVPGTDLGIISFNETVLKELLDITVVTTDFAQMGKTVAGFILDKQIRQVQNPFSMIRRHSL